jgi:hypothetical protein
MFKEEVIKIIDRKMDYVSALRDEAARVYKGSRVAELNAACKVLDEVKQTILELEDEDADLL